MIEMRIPLQAITAEGQGNIAVNRRGNNVACLVSNVQCRFQNDMLPDKAHSEIAQVKFSTKCRLCAEPGSYLLRQLAVIQFDQRVDLIQFLQGLYSTGYTLALKAVLTAHRPAWLQAGTSKHELRGHSQAQETNQHVSHAVLTHSTCCLPLAWKSDASWTIVH